MSPFSIALFVLAFLALLASGPLWALAGAFIYYRGRHGKPPWPDALTRKPAPEKPDEPPAPRGRVLKP
jgi:hypothetical protein